MNFDKNLIENKSGEIDIISTTVETVGERRWLIDELEQRMDEFIKEGIDKTEALEKIKEALAFNLKFEVEKKIMEKLGVDEDNKEAKAKFREEYPLEEIHNEIYNMAEEIWNNFSRYGKNKN